MKSYITPFSANWQIYTFRGSWHEPTGQLACHDITKYGHRQISMVKLTEDPWHNCYALRYHNLVDPTIINNYTINTWWGDTMFGEIWNSLQRKFEFPPIPIFSTERQDLTVQTILTSLDGTQNPMQNKFRFVKDLPNGFGRFPGIPSVRTALIEHNDNPALRKYYNFIHGKDVGLTLMWTTRIGKRGILYVRQPNKEEL